MATVASAFDDRSMSIGRVFQRALSTIVHNPVAVLGLALVIGAIPGLLVTFLFVSLGLRNTTGDPSGTAMLGLAFGGLATSVISLAISAIVQGALTRATVAESEGHRASIGECLSVGLRFFLPLIGAGIIVGFGIVLGMILLIVPGIIVLLMWAVVAPVVVVERDGVFKALSRSRELTKGARPKIFGLFFVLGVAYWLLSVVFGYVGLEAYGGADGTDGFTTGSLLGTVLLGTIFNAFWGTIQPSLYLELRQWKEGDSAEALEKVFA